MTLFQTMATNSFFDSLAIYHLFPIVQKSRDLILIFIYSLGYVISIRNPHPKMFSLSVDL